MIAVKILVSCLIPLACTFVDAAVIDATPFIKEQGGRDGLLAAVELATDGDTVTFDALVSLSSRIVIKKTITLDGGNNIIRDHGSIYNLLRVESPGTTIININFQMAMTGGFRNAIGVVAENVTVKNCMVHGGGSGVGVYGLGEPPRGIVVEDTVFTNMHHSISFNRDVARVDSTNPQERASRALRGGVFAFKNNVVGGRTHIGFTIDCGNDGTNGSETAPEDEARPFVTDTVTKFTSSDGERRSVIENNKLGNIEKFGVALATTSGFDVINNSITLGGIHSHTFRGSIHMEHNSADNNFVGNTFSVFPGSDNKGAGVILVTFTDYGNPATHLQGVRDTVFKSNVFQGQRGRGFSGTGFKSISVIDNDFTRILANDGVDYSTYRTNGEPIEYKVATGNIPSNPTA